MSSPCIPQRLEGDRSMRVVITGGAGFLGKLLARRILQKGFLQGPDGPQRVEELVVFDNDLQGFSSSDPRVHAIQGRINDPEAIQGLLAKGPLSVFHLASIVSGGAERDFDLALEVNLRAHIGLLEALRSLGSRPRYVFASSTAVYGSERSPYDVGDHTRHTPQTTYGMTKSVGELLVNDYTRKGYIDGRSARLATVIVRPGPPNAAASGFVSGVLREPLSGIDYTLPVSLETRVPVVSYRTVVEGLLALHDLPGTELGADRALNLPSLSLSMRDLLEALGRVAGEREVGRVRVVPDDFTQRIVASWPSEMRSERADALGLPRDQDIDSIIQTYIRDFLS
jgi:D-erythronate 2-dehydrogenase